MSEKKIKDAVKAMKKARQHSFKIRPVEAQGILSKCNERNQLAQASNTANNEATELVQEVCKHYGSDMAKLKWSIEGDTLTLIDEE